jgi:Flp pilus assembly protein TadG
MSGQEPVTLKDRILAPTTNWNSSFAEAKSMKNAKSTGFMTSLGARLRSFGKRTDGAAAVEFAFIVPVMLALYFGTMEMSQGIEVNKKAGRASSLIGDLVTQQAVITKADIVAIANIATATLQPYNRSAPIVEVVGIQVTDETVPRALVAWSQRVSGGAGSSFLGVGSPITIPAELRIRNTFLVRGGLTVNYYPVTTWTVNTYAGGQKGIAMGEVYYLRPRTSPTITCTGC